jgi:hypothetical protein
MMMARVGFNVFDMVADHCLSAGGFNTCSLQQFTQAFQLFAVGAHDRQISALGWLMTLRIGVERRPFDRSAKQTRAVIRVLLKGRIKMRGGRPLV